MKRYPALGALALFLAVASTPVLAQTPKQTPKKQTTKTAPKPAAKAPPKKEEPAKPVPPPDLAITASYVSGDKTTTGTVLMHGARQRVSYDAAMASIQQCDEHRAVQLNTQTRVYLEMPDPTPPATPAPAPGEKHKGGTITYTTAVVDTGEKKEMFGLPAHHLKTTVTKESS